MPVSFRITHNLIDKDEPETVEATLKARWGPVVPDKAMAQRFRLYDDDKTLYFRGRCTDTSFDPLDIVGESYGCTYIF